MGESSQNENLILIEENQTNENEMYIEKHVEIIEGENAQTKNNKVQENGKQIMNFFFAKIHVQRKFVEGKTKKNYVRHFIV
jgi:hypothetical protein